MKESQKILGRKTIERRRNNRKLLTMFYFILFFLFLSLSFIQRDKYTDGQTDRWILPSRQKRDLYPELKKVTLLKILLLPFYFEGGSITHKNGKNKRKNKRKKTKKTIIRSIWPPSKNVSPFSSFWEDK